MAKALVRDACHELGDQALWEPTEVEAIQGKGLRGTVRGKQVWIGNQRLAREQIGTVPNAIEQSFNELQQQGKTSMYVIQEGTIVGILALQDLPRPEAKETLVRLRQLYPYRFIMLTGDNQQTANTIARQLDLTEARGDLLPEDKVSAILQLMQEGKVAMVGDGVNDAPAMANSTVGIAMGAAGSDVALETADIALMADQLDRLPLAIGLSRRARRIIKQNLYISLGVVALLVPATILGWTNIGLAVFFHEGSTMVVVLNALRLLGHKDR
ncbi:HAD-IC family P-type ATPase [Croceiramulus getboli]|nr:HAD-IC family P-type ATPase [Flavobacteriaceae bacterium YJPT1-3]